MGALGQAVKYLLLAGPLLSVVSWFIEFAIFGTFALAFGLTFLAMAVWRGRIAKISHPVLISSPQPAPLPGTPRRFSAFFLVGVRLIWLILSIGLLPVGGEGGDGF